MKDAFLQKLEKRVSGLFEEVRAKAEAAGEKFVRTPFTEELISVLHYDFLFPYFEQTVCRALIAREEYRKTAPFWSPELPVSLDECERLISGKSNKLAVVGYFGRSWACANWGRHLSYCDYACGLMACEHTPERIRFDIELQLEFPPKPLEGFDQSLCWGFDDRLVEILQQLMKNEEIWRRCGMTTDAKWMRDSIEQLGRMKIDEKVRNFLDSQPDRRT